MALLMFMVMPMALLAQEKWEKPPGGIENAQVII
jgi:hypothetical protein